MLHILDRSTVHLGLQSSPVIALGVMFVLAMLRRLTKYEWLPARLFPTAFWASVLTLLGFSLREAFDVGVVRDWWGKSYIDIATHAAALTLLCLAIRKIEQWAKRGYL